MNVEPNRPAVPLPGEPVRRDYEPPRLVALGDLRELTLGASPGAGDSGGPTTFKCPGCP
jgi:hypothetical protein